MTSRTGGAERRRSGRFGRRSALAGLVGIGLIAALVQAAPAGAQEPSSRIRLGHFSPDTPEMDVYLVGFDGEETKVLEGLGYGEVSDYAPLEPGEYSFLLRPAGSPADSDPAVTASATLEDGSAYTFAAMGPTADLQQALVTDDLTPPPAGEAKVRLIQASSSADTVDVRVVDGPTLAEGAEFASTTDYAPVGAGSYTVEVTATGAEGTVSRSLDLEAGTVSSLVVLEGTDGAAYDLTRVVDATGVDSSASGGELGINAATPLGGVGPGGGGTAGAGSSSDGGLLGAPLVTGLAVAAAAAVALGGTRLARAHAGGPGGKHFAADADRDRDELVAGRRSA
jgi:hypothetical protein